MQPGRTLDRGFSMMVHQEGAQEDNLEDVERMMQVGAS